MNYAEQLRQVQALGVSAGQSKRFNCFGCDGKNSLSVTNDHGSLLWACFRASCRIKGVADTVRSVSDIRRQLANKQDRPSAFRLPEYLTSVMSSDRAIRYLEKNNCLEAFRDGRAEIRYDPRADRVVFVLRHSGEIVDAAGRSLNRDTKPKWLRYGASKHPFVCGEGGTAVVVEDCASACAVSGVATGIALLGTNLQSSVVSILKAYPRVIVALDPDATAKALALRQQLSYFCEDVRTLRLPDDLKYYKADQISTILGLEEAG